jgi:hypothetical protein
MRSGSPWNWNSADVKLTLLMIPAAYPADDPNNTQVLVLMKKRLNFERFISITHR